MDGNLGFSPFRSAGFPGRKKVILLLSMGDICRSPMAAGYLRKLLTDRKINNVEVRSAGVMTVPGLRASQEASQIMENEGVDLSRHRSSQLSYELVRRADLILGMTPIQVQEALRLCKDAKNKSFLFKHFTASDLKNVMIQDPMGSTLEVFKKCFKEIRDACNRLVESDFVNGRKPVTVLKPMDPSLVVKSKPVKKESAKAVAAPVKAVAKPAAPAPKPAPAPAKAAKPTPAKPAPPKPKAAAAKPVKPVAAAPKAKAKPTKPTAKAAKPASKPAKPAGKSAPAKAAKPVKKAAAKPSKPAPKKPIIVKPIKKVGKTPTKKAALPARSAVRRQSAAKPSTRKVRS